ncbi:sugar phosphate isomerase/epimerase family protein [Rhodophyticola sp.]|uniref:sugar phosphate isomerase/epimerase family protein n=1 Tax=Rhodophyticola sp. TaxID=2680032 RepID=UPI003D28F508
MTGCSRPTATSSAQSFFFAETLDSDWQPADEARRQLDGLGGSALGHFENYHPFDGPGHSARRWGTHDAELDVAARHRRGPDDPLTYTTWDYSNLDNIPGSRAKVIEFTRDMAAVVKRAEDQGVTLVIENIMDIGPAERSARWPAALDPERVKLSVDAGHAHYAHGSTGAPPVDYFIQDAGAQLEHVHLQDADGYADRHWSLGEGTILWDAVFRAIAALEHSPRRVLELRDKTRIPRAMAYLADRGLAR